MGSTVRNATRKAANSCNPSLAVSPQVATLAMCFSSAITAPPDVHLLVVSSTSVNLASDDSLVAAMFWLMPKSLEETVMFANEDEGFQELYDRLLAHSCTKQSIQMIESKKNTKKDDPMDVDALNKGAGKGTSKGKGKKSKGKDKPSNAENSNWPKGWTEKGDEQADGWWKTTDWQRGTGSGWWTTANDWTPWESEEPMGQIEISSMESSVETNSMDRCSSNSSKNPRRGRRRRPRKKRQTVIRPYSIRAKSRGTTRITARHEDQHRRTRKQ